MPRVTLRSLIGAVFFVVAFSVSVVATEGRDRWGIYLCIRPLERFESLSNRKTLEVHDCNFGSEIDENTIINADDKWTEKLGHCFLVLAKYLGDCTAADGSGRKLKVLECKASYGFGGTGTSNKKAIVDPETSEIFQKKMPISAVRVFCEDDLDFSEPREHSVLAINELWKRVTTVMDKEREKGYSYFSHHCCTVAERIACDIINVSSVDTGSGRYWKYERFQQVLYFLRDVNFGFGFCGCYSLPTAKPCPGQDFPY